MFDTRRFESSGLKTLRRFADSVAAGDPSVLGELPVPLYRMPIPTRRPPALPNLHQSVTAAGSCWFYERGHNPITDRFRNLRDFMRFGRPHPIRHPLMIEFLTAATHALHIMNIRLIAPRYDFTSKAQRRSPGKSNVAGLGLHADDELRPHKMLFIWEDGTAPTLWANGTAAPSHTVMFYCGETRHSAGRVIGDRHDKPDVPREMLRLGIDYTYPMPGLPLRQDLVSLPRSPTADLRT